MFFQKLKRQYFAWCIFASGIGISHIIENVRAFDLLGLLVNALMVLALAFICYCITYCVCALLSLLGINLPKFLSLLLIALVLFSVMPISNTEANAGKVAKDVGKKAFLFVAGVIIGDKADDVWDASEDWLQDQVDTYVYEPIGDAATDVWDAIVHECPDCGTPGAKSYHSGSGAVNCPAYSSGSDGSSSGSHYWACGRCSYSESGLDYDTYMSRQSNPCPVCGL